MIKSGAAEKGNPFLGARRPPGQTTLCASDITYRRSPTTILHVYLYLFTKKTKFYPEGGMPSSTGSKTLFSLRQIAHLSSWKKQLFYKL